MAKPSKNSLGAALSSAAGKKAAAKPGPVVVGKKEPPTTKLLQAHYPLEIHDALTHVRMKTRRNTRQILGEAINDLCAKYGVPEPYREDEG